MFPIRDENPVAAFAWVTLVFIAVNASVCLAVRSALTASQQELLLEEGAAVGRQATTGSGVPRVGSQRVRAS